MPQNPESPSRFPQHLTLWQWGLFLIIFGLLANQMLTALMPLTPPLTNAQQGEAFGRGVGTFLSVMTGVVLIIVHFVRRRPRR